jgi:hypothetical protein
MELSCNFIEESQKTDESQILNGQGPPETLLLDEVDDLLLSATEVNLPPTSNELFFSTVNKAEFMALPPET